MSKRKQQGGQQQQHNTAQQQQQQYYTTTTTTAGPHKDSFAVWPSFGSDEPYPLYYEHGVGGGGGGSGGGGGGGGDFPVSPSKKRLRLDSGSSEAAMLQCILSPLSPVNPTASFSGISRVYPVVLLCTGIFYYLPVTVTVTVTVTVVPV
jgi:hypothetical protein